MWQTAASSKQMLLPACMPHQPTTWLLSLQVRAPLLMKLNPSLSWNCHLSFVTFTIFPPLLTLKFIHKTWSSGPPQGPSSVVQERLFKFKRRAFKCTRLILSAVTGTPFVIVNTIAGGLMAFGLTGLRYSGKSIVLYLVVLCLQSLTSNQLQIFCVWLTPNQVQPLS